MISEVHATYVVAMSECPVAVQSFFGRLAPSTAVDIRVMKVQLEIWLDGEKVGGFNRGKPQHWYFSILFVGSRPANRVLTALFIEKNKPGHQWYQLNNRPGATAVFEATLAEFLGREI